MYNEALISECCSVSSLHLCALMHDLVPFTEVPTSVQLNNQSNARCHYLLEPVALIPLYRNEMKLIIQVKVIETDRFWVRLMIFGVFI